MRRRLPMWMMVLSSAAAHAGAAEGSDSAPDIVGVLARSQQVRLDAIPLADVADARAATVRASFDMLVRRLPGLPPVELRVTRGEIVAETLHGRIVIANEALADRPKGERLFVLAHELGHVMLEHWAQMGSLYQKWIPGEVVQHKTDAVAQQLGREGSALAQRQEIEADAFGLRTIRTLGLSEQDAMNAFMHLGMRNDTATHSGTRKRIAALRAIDPDQLQAAVPSASGR
jgi:Zn-dependent protease with chaperone function